MTFLKRGLWASAAAAVLAGGAVAQTTTTTTGTTTTGTTTTTGGAAPTGSSSTPGANGGIQLQQTAEAPTITAPSESSTRSTAVATSNGFGNFYNNPMYQGRAGSLGTGLTTVNAPGGFGTALYTSTGGSGAAGAGGVGGAAGSNANRATTSSTGLGGTAAGGRTGTTGLGGTSGGLGGTAGRGGAFGGTNTQQNQQNQQLSTGRTIAYTQTLKFAGAPAPQPAQLAVDLQAMIASSSAVTSRGVQVSAADGGVVVLRGKVADDDERRLVEGMVMLTPGVKQVQNELTTQ